MAVYLIPTFLGEGETGALFTPCQLELVNTLTVFAVEEARTARRDLRKMGYTRPFEEVTMYEVGKHAPPDMPQKIIRECASLDLGLISEAGVPAVADPGGALVLEAQLRGIRCVPLVGPSSILLALMASGLNGQNFAFNGYLPIDAAERRKKIRFYETRSAQENQTQIFIETPFRNRQLYGDLLAALKPSTLLTIASDITGPDERIRTQTAAVWQNLECDFHKQQAVFLFLASDTRYENKAGGTKSEKPRTHGESGINPGSRRTGGGQRKRS